MRSIILLLLAAIPALATYPNGYNYRRTITVQAAQVPSTQTDFPMLISGTYDGTAGTADLRTVANGGKVNGVCNQTTIVISVGCDIIFTSDAAGSTILNFEWETYSASTGVLNVWVKVPSISNGTVIYMFYGNSSISTFQGNVTGTWDSSFKGVWHTKDGSTLSAADSTSNANNGTLVNTPTAAAGKIDGSASMASASSQKITVSSNAGLKPASITVSGWVKGTTFPNSYNTAVSKESSGSADWTLLVKSTGKLAVYVMDTGAHSINYDGTGSTTLSTGTLYHVAFTFDSSISTGQLKGYVNGAQDGTANGFSLGLLTNNLDLEFGGTAGYANRYWNGVLDELRVSDSARSANWITTEYNNQSAPASFYALGAETLAGGGAALIIR